MVAIRDIRDQLNALTFEQGERAAWIGSIEDLWPGADSASVASQLEQLQAELVRHDLKLERRGPEGQDLYAVQSLKYRDVDMTWMAKGIQWVAQITTVALEMVVPGVLGWWLDQRWDTQFLGIVGLLLGVTLGIWHLLKLTRSS